MGGTRHGLRPDCEEEPRVGAGVERCLRLWRAWKLWRCADAWRAQQGVDDEPVPTWRRQSSRRDPSPAIFANDQERLACGKCIAGLEYRPMALARCRIMTRRRRVVPSHGQGLCPNLPIGTSPHQASLPGAEYGRSRCRRQWSPPDNTCRNPSKSAQDVLDARGRSLPFQWFPNNSRVPSLSPGLTS
jgi:hypothetical protein